MKNISKIQLVAAAIIHKGGKVLIARRAKKGHFGGLWEFPGGKVKFNESPQQALRRELFEEFGIEARIGAPFSSVKYTSPHLSLLLHAYEVFSFSGNLTPKEHQEVRWVSAKELGGYDFSPPDQEIVEKIKSRKREKDEKKSGSHPEGRKRKAC